MSGIASSLASSSNDGLRFGFSLRRLALILLRKRTRKNIRVPPIKSKERKSKNCWFCEEELSMNYQSSTLG